MAQDLLTQAAAAAREGDLEALGELLSSSPAVLNGEGFRRTHAARSCLPRCDGRHRHTSEPGHARRLITAGSLTLF